MGGIKKGEAMQKRQNRKKLTDYAQAVALNKSAVGNHAPNYTVTISLNRFLLA
jgi:hypothetical protein